MKRILLVLFLCSNCWAGVIAQWKLNDNALSTTVVDSVGPHNGTFKDATGDPNTSAHDSTGKINGALTFDGIDDYVEVGDCSATGNVDSVAMWVKQTSALSDPLVIIRVSTSDFIYIQSETLVSNCHASDVHYIDGILSSTVTAGSWHFIVVVIPAGGVSPTGVRIVNTTYDLFFSGLIDNVIFFNKELTALEVRRLYNGGAGTEYVGRTNLRTRYTSGYGFNYRNRYKF